MRAPRSVLRDYYGPQGVARMTALADYRGDTRHWSRTRRLTEGIVGGNSRAVGTLTGIPAQWERDWELLRDPLERRLLARAVLDESLLTRERRRSIVSILLWTGMAMWATAAIVLAVAAQQHMAGFRAASSLFFYGIATSLFLPLPFETIVGSVSKEIGIAATVLVAAVSKVVGAWIVLILGDRAYDRLEHLLHGRATARRIWERVLKAAQRYGYAFIFVVFAIPFMSDTLPLILLAVMNLRKRVFLLVTFVAFVLRTYLVLVVGSLFS